MMEPVARIDADALKELEKHPGAYATVWSGKAGHRFALDAVPLVRLSDAEARIRELEAEVEKWKRQPHYVYIGKDGKAVKARDLEDRAEAAEALLNEQEAKIERLMLFGGRMANACYNISRKVEVSSLDKRDLHFAQLEWDEAARAIHHKIGVKDE